MGYEIAGGLGAKMAAPDREVFVLVGDGSYLMMATEIVTAVAERIKLVIILVDNRGFASIGSLSESLGSQRFGTRYRYRNPDTGLLDGGLLPVDLAANAASLGADVLKTRTVKEFQAALEQVRASDQTTVVYVETDPLAPAPSSEAWWDVPVSEVSALDSTQKARAAYEAAKRGQRPYV
jgi:3D-(3,5/4)-trihydroxycyclohexane-1,2-dione acylhydrolase (decyclizing)